MSEDAVVCDKLGLTLSGRAMSTAPTLVKKQVDKTMSRNKKEKLRKKRKSSSRFGLAQQPKPANIFS
jgi:hypothetical protein